MLTDRFKPVLRKRQGVAIGVWGEAGIGKSYQVTGLLRELPCRNASFHATTPLTILAKTLPRPQKLALWATRTLERLERSETSEPATLLDAFTALLAGLAPFVLHLEDLHEADTERLEFILALARMVQRSKGVGLIVTSRNEPSEPFTPFRLEPLPPESSSLLLEQELTATLPEDASQWIYARACGNPLYTLEYLRYLTRQGFLWSDGKAWHWRKPEGQFMPATIEALIERLMGQAQSEPLYRYVLETKALLPIHASDELWCKVARVNAQELATAVTALLHQSVFQENNFAHPLFREVTLKTMGVARKRHLSRRALAALEDEPEQAALFVEEAGLEREQALEILKRAAEQAKEHNKVQAARFLAKAVDYAEGEERGKLALEAATLLKDSDLSTSVRLAELALTLKTHDTATIDLLAELYALLKQRNKAEQVLGYLSEEEKISAKALPRLVKLYGRLHDHQAILELVRHHPELLQTNDANILYDLAWTMFNMSEQEQTKTLIVHSLAILDTSDRRRTQFNYLKAITLSSFDNNDVEAEKVFRQCLIAFRQESNTFSVIATLHAHATTLQYIGNYSEALLELEEAAELSIQLGNISQYAEMNLAIADQLCWCGNYERAEVLYLDSLSIIRSHDDTDYLLDCLTNLVILYCNWHLPYSTTLALKYGQEALVLAKTLDNPRALVSALCALAKALVLFRNPTEASSLADEATSLAQTPNQELKARIAKAEAIEALGLSDEALELFHNAKDLATQLRRPYPEHLVGLELDRLNNDVDSARGRLKWFQERGLMNGVNIARRYFPELEQKPISQGIAEPSGRLEVLGSMQFFVNGKQETVRGRKRKELFACLLEARMAGRSQLSQLDLADKLHPENPDENLEGVKQLVFQVRSAFGQTVIITSGNGYTLGAISSDAETFLENGDTSLWRGEYLEGIEGRDDIVSGALHHALSGRVKDLLVTDPAEAARVGRMLVKAEPYELESWRLTLKAVQQSSTLQSVEKLYREGCKRMAEVGEVLPESWETFLNQVTTPQFITEN
jgi:hypothetical protein